MISHDPRTTEQKETKPAPKVLPEWHQMLVAANRLSVSLETVHLLPELPGIRQLELKTSCGRTFEFPEFLREEIFVNGLRPEQMTAFPEYVRSSIYDTGLNLFGTASLTFSEYATAAKYLLLSDRPKLNYFLANAERAVNLGCNIGLGDKHQYNKTRAIAIDNIGIGTSLLDGLLLSTEDFRFSFEITPEHDEVTVYNPDWNPIPLDGNEQPRTITRKYQAPEALWTMRIELTEEAKQRYNDAKDDTDPNRLGFRFLPEASAVARFGINLHREESGIIASVSLIQGLDRVTIRKLKSTKLSKNLIHWAIVGLQAITASLPNRVSTVRGIPAIYHPSNGRDGFDVDRLTKVYDGNFVSAGFRKVMWKSRQDAAESESCFPTAPDYPPEREPDFHTLFMNRSPSYEKAFFMNM